MISMIRNSITTCVSERTLTSRHDIYSRDPWMHETSCKFQDALVTILHFQRANAFHQRSFENSTMESWMHGTRAPRRWSRRIWEYEWQLVPSRQSRAKNATDGRRRNRWEMQWEAFKMRRSKKRRGWRKMLRSQRGHTVDDILFLALKPLRHLDIFQVFSVPLMPFLPHRRK